MIRISNIAKKFGDKEVLREVSLDFEQGQTTAVLGQSGCGKSVLLKIILRLMPFDSGKIIVDDIDTSGFSEQQMMAIRKRMGMLFQGSALFDSLSVFENLAFPLREHTGMTDGQIDRRVSEVLDFVDLENCENLMPSELSGGMQKRVALARALITNPDYIFFDEPTTGLDPITSRTINKLIKRVHDTIGSTLIVVTHDIKSAAEVAQKITLLHQGRIHFEGDYRDFCASQDDFIKAFRSARKENMEDGQ